MTSLDRRSYLGGLASSAAVGLAGCMDLITGDGPLEVAADPAEVPAARRDGTGYTLDVQEPMEIERTVKAAGQERRVVVTNWLTRYTKDMAVGPGDEVEAAIFAALTTPQFEVLGREFNPVADLSTRELAERVQDQYEGIENLEHRRDETVTVAGQSTTESVFDAETTVAGRPIDLHLHVTPAVELADNLVVTVGGYPAPVPDEDETIHDLMDGVASAN